MRHDEAITPTKAAIADTFVTLIDRLNRNEEANRPEIYKFTIQQLLEQFPVSFSQWVAAQTDMDVDNSRLADDTVTAMRQFALKYQNSDFSFREYARFLDGIKLIALNNWTGGREVYRLEIYPDPPIERQIDLIERKGLVDAYIRTTSFI